MKVAVVCLALVTLVFSAPQTRKVFHENVEEFLSIIFDVAGEDLNELSEHYSEFEEFWTTIEYMRSTDFKNLVYEMEDLPEFKAVVEFLERDNIDIMYFLDVFNDLLENGPPDAKRTRHDLSGTDFNSFVRDCIAFFPKDQLSALFDQKMSDDEEFRVAIQNLNSDEWSDTFDSLWKSDVFQAEVITLAKNGIDVHVLLNELFAIFGQN